MNASELARLLGKSLADIESTVTNIRKGQLSEASNKALNQLPNYQGRGDVASVLNLLENQRVSAEEEPLTASPRARQSDSNVPECNGITYGPKTSPRLVQLAEDTLSKHKQGLIQAKLIKQTKHGERLSALRVNREYRLIISNTQTKLVHRSKAYAL